MYKITVDETPMIAVNTAKDSIVYSVNGSKMNPLEAFYASLVGCAAVYAKKACKELGISASGIEINCVPRSGVAGPLSLSKFKTEIKFPESFSKEQKEKIIDSIQHCAVKEIVKDGDKIEFVTEEII